MRYTRLRCPGRFVPHDGFGHRIRDASRDSTAFPGELSEYVHRLACSPEPLLRADLDLPDLSGPRPPHHRSHANRPHRGTTGSYTTASSHRLDDVGLIDVTRVVLDTAHGRAEKGANTQVRAP
ncbi:hypothetical protein SSPO_004820 [Streptomyces antimycoticus]|uniref:Uncharacterized protein n=1 Tax=Streptomyces antimycoticus TaxID=68175 RepID=A0A499UAG6_9ACTN|nr:hypothetical protein SSPO_004820 [Streptomyces antimycoticus]